MQVEICEIMLRFVKSWSAWCIAPKFARYFYMRLCKNEGRSLIHAIRAPTILNKLLLLLLILLFSLPVASALGGLGADPLVVEVARSSRASENSHSCIPSPTRQFS